MKKWIAALLSLVTALAMLPLSLAEEAPVYLALGDSISTGYGLAEGEKGFAWIVAEEHGYTLINRAVNGNVAPGILAQLADPALLKEVERAELITVTCGGNDLMALLFQQLTEAYNANVPQAMTSLKIQAQDVVAIMSDGEDPRQPALMAAAQAVLGGNAEMGVVPFVQSDAMKNGLDAYLKTMGAVMEIIRSVNPDVKIILATQYNPYNWFTGDYAGLNQSVNAGVMALSKCISDAAAVMGYQVADVHTAFAASADNLMNASMEPLNLDVHPNADGHAVIAACFSAVLDPAQ